MPGSLNKTPIAGLRTTTSHDRPMDVGEAVRPEDHFAAIAIRDGVSRDSGISTHVSRGGMLNSRVCAVQVATNQDSTTPCHARHVNVCRNQADLIA